MGLGSLGLGVSERGQNRVCKVGSAASTHYAASVGGTPLTCSEVQLVDPDPMGLFGSSYLSVKESRDGPTLRSQAQVLYIDSYPLRNLFLDHRIVNEFDD